MPLAYPGRALTEPALLTDRTLLELLATPAPLRAWRVLGRGPRAVRPRRELDRVLSRLGQATTEHRRPVIGVGANASPDRLRRKLAAAGRPWAVPMVPVRVSGVALGCSGHISRGGYVAAAPYADACAEATFVVSWLDDDQLRTVDVSEFPNYRRALLPGERFAMILPSGERLAAAHLYVSVHGVLADAGGRPVPGGGPQADLLSMLLGASARLRELLGPGPDAWVAKAGADRSVREQGTRLLREEGRVPARNDFAEYG
ncbi:hypothetical protein [Streptomyces meridianus]|uniref:Uncharacterized protein n=1 Tax=Streptomyces meridianus TaxID=2938945 RepID=A0ABT0X754_9ACTN|nr:hypothetical protein [Streptomyces meridianus]MCM2578145.1 hypothetical protein [Streptomyces meridianus]